MKEDFQNSWPWAQIPSCRLQICWCWYSKSLLDDITVPMPKQEILWFDPFHIPTKLLCFSTVLSSHLSILFTGMLLEITLSSNKYIGLDDTGWRQLEGNETASRMGNQSRAIPTFHALSTTITICCAHYMGSLQGGSFQTHLTYSESGLYAN